MKRNLMRICGCTLILYSLLNMTGIYRFDPLITLFVIGLSSMALGLTFISLSTQQPKTPSRR